jgi:hypothetical protein
VLRDVVLQEDTTSSKLFWMYKRKQIIFSKFKIVNLCSSAI